MRGNIKMVQVEGLKSGKKMKDTPIGEIPVDWTYTHLGEILDKIVGGGTPSRANKEYFEGNIPWATVKDMGPLFLEDTQEHITEESIRNSATNLIPKDVLVIATRMGLGQCFITRKPIAINQDLKALFPSKRVLTQFLLWWFLFNSERLEHLGSGTTVKGIRLEVLKYMPIVLPPPSEQNEITEILTSVDNAIQKTDQVIEKTKELKKGLMQHLLTKGIGHKEFKKTGLGSIPLSWKVGVLEDIAEINMGQSPDGSTYNFDGNGTPIINGPTEFTNYSPIPIQYTTAPIKICKAGDILFCVRGSTTGRMNISDREYCIGRGVASIRQKEDSFTKYLYYSLLKDEKKILKEASGGGSTFPNINRRELCFRQICIPPMDEQKRIAAILTYVDSNIEVGKRFKSHITELKKALIQQLLTGKVRVVAK